MKLYSVNYKGPVSMDEWSIVTIHKTREGAEEAMSSYIENYGENIASCEYTIWEIDTDTDSDIVYDYDWVNTDND